MFENQKKRNVEIKDIFYINLHLRDRLDTEFTEFAEASLCYRKR